MTTGFRDLADWSRTSPTQLVAVHLAKCPNTERGYREDMTALAGWMGEKDVCEAARKLLDNGRAAAKRMLITWVNDMRSKGLSANTVRRRAASVKSLITTAADPDIEVIGWEIGRLPNLPPAIRVRDVAGPSIKEVDRMVTACRERDDAKGKRDEAIMALLYFEALRASEVLSIRVQDVDLVAGKVRIVGKRAQGRVDMDVCEATVRCLAKWLDARGGWKRTSASSRATTATAISGPPTAPRTTCAGCFPACAPPRGSTPSSETTTP